jgi:endonuclease/exonuclease/phosphatase (EEP) superfamily protein YafD
MDSIQAAPRLAVSRVSGLGGGSPPRQGATRHRRAVMVVSWSCLAYFAAIFGLWALLWTVGDRWWLATLVTYGPRWVWAAPLSILIPAAAVIRPKLLWLLLIAGVVVIGPVMGFCVPRPTMAGEPAAAFTIRVLTCNAGGVDLRPGALAELIAATRPDVVALQEGSVRSLPAGSWSDGWDLRTTVASRYPILEVEKLRREDLGGDGFVTRFDLDTPGGLVHFFNLHLETVREGLEAVLSSKRRPWKGAPGLSANIDLRARESEVASRWVGEVSGPVLIAGDFNLPADSDIFQLFWSPYTDAFSSAGLGLGYTKFTRWHGIRIDHILAGPGWRCRRCWVGPDVGSDHRPVLADLVWIGTGG